MPLAKQHALANGCLDAILVNRDGTAIGTTVGSLFTVIEGGVVLAAGQREDAAALAVAVMVGEGGGIIAEYSVKPADLLLAEEVFLAGTACGVIAIVRIDGRDVGVGTEGPVTRSIRERFHALTRSG
jgi:branched-chain amino acid aminotransferase